MLNKKWNILIKEKVKNQKGKGKLWLALFFLFSLHLRPSVWPLIIACSSSFSQLLNHTVSVTWSVYKPKGPESVFPYNFKTPVFTNDHETGIHGKKIPQIWAPNYSIKADLWTHSPGIFKICQEISPSVLDLTLNPNTMKSRLINEIINKNLPCVLIYRDTKSQCLSFDRLAG